MVMLRRSRWLCRLGRVAVEQEIEHTETRFTQGLDLDLEISDRYIVSFEDRHGTVRLCFVDCDGGS